MMSGRGLLPSQGWERRTALFIVLALTALLTHDIWLSDKYIVFGDLDFGMRDGGYLNRIYGLFNSDFSSTNFFNLSRLAFTAPLYGLSLLLGGTLPGFLLKCIILLILLASATGMFFLCESLFVSHFGQLRWHLHYFGMVIPSLFYAVNPWVMFRIQHIFLLAGYAMYPFIVRYTLELFDTQFCIRRSFCQRLGCTAEQGQERLRSRPCTAGWREGWRASVKIAFFIGVGSASIHYFFYYFITLLFFGIILFFRGMTGRKQDLVKYTVKYARKAALLGISVFAFTAYWLVPYMISALQFNFEPQNVNVDDTLSLFSRYSDVKHVLYMVSYWWPMFNMERYLDSLFWASGGVLLALIVIIVFYRYSWHFYIRLFTWAAVAAALIALGVNTVIIRDLNIYIVTKIPLVGQIFRDPNKLIGPMALYFAVLIGFGTDRLLYALRSSGFGAAVRVAFLLALLCCIYFYYRPFQLIFTKNYYAGVSLPPEYQEVQEHYLKEGKIIWNPVLDNMTLSNGLSGYSWNDAKTGIMKTSGDFHMYSSSKPTFTQNEGNFGMVGYFHSFIQKFLDTGGAQHLGTLLSWSGFNELGFHKDVKAQEERQAYNQQMLDGQPDLDKHYSNGLFSLYRTAFSLPAIGASNRALHMTKGLDTLMGVLDYPGELGLEPERTALLWTQERLQPIQAEPEDLIIGDNKWDMLFSQLPSAYFTFPFDQVNTGNPYTGWAKTLMKTTDWDWLKKTNQLSSKSWEYDYGHGIVYTYTPFRLSVPAYQVNGLTGPDILGKREILDGFFTPDNPDLLKLAYFPYNDLSAVVMSGTVEKGATGTGLWQVAKSKLISLDPEHLPRFVKMRAVVSGIDAGSMHFKIRFLDERKQELDVAYVSGNSDIADFSYSEIGGMSAVPPETRYLRVDILSSQDSAATSYFWVHDFSIQDVSRSGEANLLQVSLPGKKPGRYRTFVRVYASGKMDSLTVQASGQTRTIPVSGQPGRFIWLDMGALDLNGTLTIVPEAGLQVISAVLTIPEEQFPGIMRQAEAGLQGTQADISIVSHDYTQETSFDLSFLESVRTYPGSLSGSLFPVSQGVLTKPLYVLREGEYRFQFNGYLPPGSSAQVELVREDGGGAVKLAALQELAGGVSRSFPDYYNEVSHRDGSYYLRLQENKETGWEIRSYSFAPVRLASGAYTVRMSLASNKPNISDASSLHLMKSEEIIVPREMLSQEQLLAALLDNTPVRVQKEESPDSDAIRFVNEPTASSQWMILSLNRSKVSKGQLLAFQSQVSWADIHDLHVKLMFVKESGELVESKLAEANEAGDVFRAVMESPLDGYVQPCFFYKGDSLKPGQFSMSSSEIYGLSGLIKAESTALLPESVTLPAGQPEVEQEPGGRFSVQGGRFLIYNEAYNPIWRRSDSTDEPVAVNLLNTGFLLPEEGASGALRVNPVLQRLYSVCLFISAAAHLAGFMHLAVQRAAAKRRRAGAAAFRRLIPQQKKSDGTFPL